MTRSRYQFVRLLRRGGVAELWEGRCSGPEGFARAVALKVVRGAIDPQVRAEFLDEARIGALFRHPNVVPVLDFGSWDGGSYQVLELVDGLDLHAAGSRARALSLGVPEVVALRIVRDAALGLDYVHNLTGEKGPLGIVHRDVSPGNLLLSWEGTTRVVDFGSATFYDRTANTFAGLVKGTPAFMAPEQWVGNAATPRTDVFALSLVLHWLLTRESPMKEPEARTRVLQGEPVPVSSAISPEVRELLERGLAVQPKRRLGSCLELAELCDRLLTSRGDRRTKSALTEWLRAMRPAAESAHPIESLFMLGGGDEASEGHEPAEIATEVFRYQPGSDPERSDPHVSTPEDAPIFAPEDVADQAASTVPEPFVGGASERFAGVVPARIVPEGGAATPWEDLSPFAPEDAGLEPTLDPLRPPSTSVIAPLMAMTAAPSGATSARSSDRPERAASFMAVDPANTVPPAIVSPSVAPAPPPAPAPAPSIGSASASHVPWTWVVVAAVVAAVATSWVLSR